jgi:hypothetical protein
MALPKGEAVGELRPKEHIPAGPLTRVIITRGVMR